MVFLVTLIYKLSLYEPFKSVRFFAIAVSCFSQSNKQVAFQELTVENGLSQNSVVSIAQDSTGYIWFATQDGFNNYDGRDFTHFDIQFEDVTRATYSKLGKHMWQKMVNCE